VSRFTLEARLIGSTDLDQSDRFQDGKLTIDDTTMTEGNTAFLNLAVGIGTYTKVPVPLGMTNIGWLQIETDAPILVRLNTPDGTAGTEIPVSALFTPTLSQSNPAPSPNVIPSVQKGVFTLRSGIAADGNSVLLTSVWVKNPGVTAAKVKVTYGGE
jgi:hypothetical protein